MKSNSSGRIFFAGLVLALIAWLASMRSVSGIVIGPYSIASGPGGWEVCRWESAGDGPLIRPFTYTSASETGEVAPVNRRWGIFIYHWLVMMTYATLWAVAVLCFRWSVTERDSAHA
ncbi:MAG: hypothetical protein R3C49_19505 [Planctomycetaceae bacterium]